MDHLTISRHFVCGIDGYRLSASTVTRIASSRVSRRTIKDVEFCMQFSYDWASGCRIVF